MSNSERIAVIGGARTPFARARSVYQNMSASQLGGIALREAVSLTGLDPKLIEEVYFGIVSAPAEGSNIAREALFDSGLPPTIAATGINRYCASAMEAAAGIAAKIQSGQISIGVAGGVESISSVRALFSLEATNFFQDIAKAKTLGQRLSMLSKFKGAFLAPMAPGIKEPTTGLTMGQSADLMARLFKVSREEQDRFALESHQKAHAAWERKFFNSHVCKVATPDGKVIERDTDVRADSSLEKLAKLKPVFYKDGTITAGNASPLTDGASAVVLMKESKAAELGLKPL
ncbi:MAG: acetyl-CoA C-acyltransferase, partial [Proteobacteria bacterium]|nr:acetyl-CoA C-acyltransferase [Pseudomonadota bacterium]